jgi:hypothetical protein
MLDKMTMRVYSDCLLWYYEARVSKRPVRCQERVIERKEVTTSVPRFVIGLGLLVVGWLL